MDDSDREPVDLSGRSGRSTSSGSSGLSLRRVRASRSAVLVEAVGEVDLRTAGTLVGFLCETGERFDAVIADLSRVTFFDSAGAQALVDACGPAEASLRLEIVASRAVRRIVRAAGLESSLSLHSTVDGARRALGVAAGQGVARRLAAVSR